MKPTASTRSVTSTLRGEDVAMGFKQGEEGHIMSILSKQLYKDAELACIREYSTNGRDAHKEAGCALPIEVNTPTALRSTLSIKDYGIGMNADNIRETYSQYGASTKRGTNDQVGMLGIGSKAALSYTDQFTVIGVKDGIRTVVSVTRTEAGGGNMKLLEESPTDQSNGVEILIAAERDNSFEEKAAHFFRFWDEGTVLLNGKPPEKLEGFRLSEEFLLVPGGMQPAATAHANSGPLRAVGRRYVRYNQDYIVMGGIPYPTNLDMLPAGGVAVVLFAPIGTVNFTPNREELQDTALTKNTIEAARGRFNALRAEELQKRVKAAQTRGEATKALTESMAALYLQPQKDSIKWNGEAVPLTVGVGPRPHRTDPGFAAWRPLRQLPAAVRHRANQSKDTDIVPSAEAVAAVWVTDYTNTAWTKRHREKLDAYASAHGIAAAESAGYILTHKSTIPQVEWLDDPTHLSWNDVRSWRDPNAPPRSGGGGVRYAGTYNAFVSGRWREGVPAADLAVAGKMFYMVGRPGRGTRQARILALAHDSYAFVILPQTRLAKFRRTFPNATHADPACTKAAREWLAALSNEHRRVLGWSDAGNIKDLVEHVKPTEVVGDAGLFGRIKADIALRERLSEEASTLKLVTAVVQERGAHPAPVATYAELVKRFPLLAELSELSTYRRRQAGANRHLHLYINAALAAEQGGNA